MEETWKRSGGKVEENRRKKAAGEEENLKFERSMRGVTRECQEIEESDNEMTGEPREIDKGMTAE